MREGGTGGREEFEEMEHCGLLSQIEKVIDCTQAKFCHWSFTSNPVQLFFKSGGNYDMANVIISIFSVAQINGSDMYIRCII